MHPASRLRRVPAPALLTFLFLSGVGASPQHREDLTSVVCPASVEVGEQFAMTWTGATGDWTFTAEDWSTVGTGRLSDCDPGTSACAPGIQTFGGVTSIDNTFLTYAHSPGSVTVTVELSYDESDGGCSGTLALTGSCTIDVGPASGDDDDSAGDDDDSAPLPTGWSDAGSFADGFGPSGPSITEAGGVLFISSLEHESPDKGERDDHRVMAPLRRGPDWAVVPGESVQGKDDVAARTRLATDPNGAVLLARTWLGPTGAARLSVDRLDSGAPSLTSLNPSAGTASSFPPESAIASDAAGVPHLAWIEGPPDRVAYVVRLEGDPETDWPQFVASDTQSIALVRTEPMLLLAVVGDGQTSGAHLLVYGLDTWSSWSSLGELSNPEPGWNSAEVAATVTPAGDIVAVFWELPPSGSGLPAGLRAVRWTPGTEVSLAEDLGLDLGLSSSLQVVAGPDAELWVAAILQADGRFVLMRRPPAGGAWEEVVDPGAAPGGISGFAMVADPSTPGLITLAQTWGSLSGSGIRVLRYQAP